MILKKNKKGVFPLISIVAIIAAAIMFFSGGIIGLKLSQIPQPIWIFLGIIILFKFIGGGRKK